MGTLLVRGGTPAEVSGRRWQCNVKRWKKCGKTSPPTPRIRPDVIYNCYKFAPEKLLDIPPPRGYTAAMNRALSGGKARIVAIFAAMILVAAGAIALRNRNLRHPSAVNIVSEAGHPIRSLYQGAGGRPMPPADRGAGPVCGTKRNWFERVLSVASVQAANCYEGGCAGHYYYDAGRACGLNCDGYQDWYIVDPYIGGPCDGWYYTGDGACFANDGSGICSCEEGSCETCY